MTYVRATNVKVETSMKAGVRFIEPPRCDVLATTSDEQAAQDQQTLGKDRLKAARLGQSRDDHNESDQHKDRERDVPIAEHDILDELLQ